MLIVNPPYTNRRGGVRLGQTSIDYSQSTRDTAALVPTLIRDYFSDNSPNVAADSVDSCSAYIPATWLAGRFRDLMTAATSYADKANDYSYGKYSITGTDIASRAVEYSKFLADEWSSKSAAYAADPSLFQSWVIENYLFNPEQLQTAANYPTRQLVRLAAGFVGAARPDLVKSLANDMNKALEFSKIDITIPGRPIKYRNLLIDATYGADTLPERGNPYFDILAIGQNMWSPLIYRIVNLAAVIAKNVNDPSKLAQSGFIKAKVPKSLFATNPMFFNWACSFDPYLVVDPSKRTPPWVLKSVSDSDKRAAEIRAVQDSQLPSIPEDKRLYSFEQLNAAKDAAIQSCPLTPADQAKLDNLVSAAISNRGLKTPTEVAAAVKIESDKLVAANKALEDEKSSKMIMAAGAAVVGLVIGYVMFKK